MQRMGIKALYRRPRTTKRAASSIWPLCSIGSAVACCRGAYRSRWRRRSASRRLRTLSLATASLKSSTLIRAASSPARHSLAADQKPGVRLTKAAAARPGVSPAAQQSRRVAAKVVRRKTAKATRQAQHSTLLPRDRESAPRAITRCRWISMRDCRISARLPAWMGTATIVHTARR